MKDVAREANLSVSTVSLALKGNSALKEETVIRVKKIAQEIGYIPDPALSALSSYRSKNGSSSSGKVIAFLVRGEGKEDYEKWVGNNVIFESAKQRARELGYKLEPFWISKNTFDCRRLDGILKARGIQLVILGPSTLNSKELHLDWNSYYVASIGRPKSLRGIPYCANNRFEDFEILASKLFDANVENIGIVQEENGPKTHDYLWGEPVDSNYREYCGFPLLELDLKLDPFSLYGKLRDWIKAHKIDGVIGTSSVIHELLQMHNFFGAKGEISGFVSMNADPADPSVAGIDPKYSLLGESVIEIVHNQYVNNSLGMGNGTTGLLIEGTWVDGESCNVCENNDLLAAVAE